MKRTFSSRPPTRTWTVAPATVEVTTAVIDPFGRRRPTSAGASGDGEGLAPFPHARLQAAAGSSRNVAMTSTNGASRVEERTGRSMLRTLPRPTDTNPRGRGDD